MEAQGQSYQKTQVACFIGYVVQAIVNNFAPLLFLTFQRQYDIPLSQITLLVTINFALQLLVDLASVKFVDRIGYRASAVLAHGLSAAGLVLLTVLPEVAPTPFLGLLGAVLVYAMGGGLLEVLISPIVEACPTPNKAGAMSLLHSFYCWGHVGVVLLSTAFFTLFGVDNWKVMALLWALIPLGNLIAFLRVPIAPLLAEGEKGMSLRQLCGKPLFWVLLLLMVCAGASEQAVSQWASTFAEKGLGVSKALGDLMGPMLFAILMGTARAFYGKYGDRMRLQPFMVGSTLLCVGGVPAHWAYGPGLAGSGGLRAMRALRGHYVAGSLQHGGQVSPRRRHGALCAAGPGGGLGMLRWPVPGGICFRGAGGRAALGNFGGNGVSAAAVGGVICVPTDDG